MTRNAAYEQFTITANLSGQVMIPLLDAKNSSIPLLRVGPVYRRNSVRFFAKMPSASEAKKLPAPHGYDRDSISFNPEMLVITSPLPPHCTVEFTRVLAHRERAKMSKKAAHRWTTTDDTGMHPAVTIQAPALKPDQVIEFEGVSYWFNNQNYKTSKSPSPFHFPSPPEPPPDVLLMQPATLQVLFSLSWLPIQVHRRSVNVVSGNPLDYARQASPMSADPQRPDEKRVQRVESQPLIVEDED